MTSYIALIHKDAGTAYGASFPDFPGCTTVAEAIEDIRAHAEEALSLYVEDMIRDGEPLPAPTSLETIMAGPEGKGAVAVVVVPSPSGGDQTVRIDIVLPEPALDRLDRQAEAHGTTREDYLAKIARDALDRVD